MEAALQQVALPSVYQLPSAFRDRKVRLIRFPPRTPTDDGQQI